MGSTGEVTRAKGARQAGGKRREASAQPTSTSHPHRRTQDHRHPTSQRWVDWETKVAGRASPTRRGRGRSGTRRTRRPTVAESRQNGGAERQKRRWCSKKEFSRLRKHAQGCWRGRRRRPNSRQFCGVVSYFSIPLFLGLSNPSPYWGP